MFTLRCINDDYNSVSIFIVNNKKGMEETISREFGFEKFWHLKSYFVYFGNKI